jgi:hypothetical protein
MIKTKTIKGIKIEFRTGREASMTSDVVVDGVIVGVEKNRTASCLNLFNELTKDKSGEKALYLKRFVEQCDAEEQ